MLYICTYVRIYVQYVATVKIMLSVQCRVTYISLAPVPASLNVSFDVADSYTTYLIVSLGPVIRGLR